MRDSDITSSHTSYSTTSIESGCKQTNLLQSRTSSEPTNDGASLIFSASGQWWAKQYYEDEGREVSPVGWDGRDWAQALLRGRRDLVSWWPRRRAEPSLGHNARRRFRRNGLHRATDASARRPARQPRRHGSWVRGWASRSTDRRHWRWLVSVWIDASGWFISGMVQPHARGNAPSSSTVDCRLRAS
jgi:hypothetical protein